MPEATATTDDARKTAGSGDDSTRGRPYYEKLRQELKNTIEEKRKLDKQLSTLENSISRLESSYLDETSVAGNIIKGFDNYIKASTSSGTGTSAGTGTSTRRKGGVSDQDKIFSRSSVSWMQRDSPLPLLGGLSPANTPSHAATPNAVSRLQSGPGTPSSTSGAGTSKAGTKKSKKAAAADKDDADADERPVKRNKVSWGRD